MLSKGGSSDMAWGANPPAQEQSSYHQFLTTGSKVQLTTSQGGTVEGLVICYDAGHNVVTLRDCNNSKQKQLRIFNLNFISNVVQLEQATPETQADCSNVYSSAASASQTAERISTAVKKQREEAMEADVPYDGQRAFVQLRRTLEFVRWDGANINVLNRVIVVPPYTVDSINVVKKDDKQCESALLQVKKILSKQFSPDIRLTPCCRGDAAA